MNITQEIIGAQSVEVQEMFRYWEHYMEEHVEFWEIPGNIDIHTEGHCERVLMHALRLGHECGVEERVMTALAHAAIFHDTRRKDNYLDVGHGGRAADYYKAFCQKRGLAFMPEAYVAMRFHDRDDKLGDDYIVRHAGDDTERWLEVYHVFKDADALDRLRLGTWCLDERYLRTPESKRMRAFAQQLVEQTIDPAELKRVYDMLAPFKDRM